MNRISTGWKCVLLICLLLACGGSAPAAERDLPRFTEEREAASLFFVKKHLPELLPVLEQLKKSSAGQYEQEIRQIFQVTEMLAELDDQKRYDLELKVWQAENRAGLLVARLSTPKDEDRKKAEADLRELAKELVNLEIQVLEMKADLLEREVGELKDEAAKKRENMDKAIKEQFESLLDRAKKRDKK
jgi:hypothetical protein